MQNYSFECIYDSMSNKNDPSIPELIPNAFEIIGQNHSYLAQELECGGSIVFEVVYLEAGNPKILCHFVVLRCNEKGEFYMKNPSEYPYQTPRTDAKYIPSDFFKDLKNEIFNDVEYAFNA